MATALQNLSSGTILQNKYFDKLHVAIVTAEWNSPITTALRQAALDTLVQAGFDLKKIHQVNVPGSVELTLGARWMCEKSEIQGVIVLGCVIQGETPHFDYVSQSVTQGITQLNVIYGKPVIFGVLTTHTMQQALDRAGGKHGNKGHEAAYTLIQMLQLQTILTK